MKIPKIPIIMIKRSLTTRFLIFLCLSFFLMYVSSEDNFVGATQPRELIAIPSQADWVDYGEIFSSGELGEWDYILWGGFAGSTVKKNDLIHLYYQGVRGYRVIPDETVTWRAIGLATSPDGINFTKYSENPVVTWFPNNNGEEGAVSSGLIIDESGNTILYYGANTEQTTELINADGRLATSLDGFHFVDQGVVLDHRDNSLWGSGDEIFPIITLQDEGQWFVYYIPNGTPQARQLGVAWGDDRFNLNHSDAVVSDGMPIEAWGMGGSAKLGPNTYALFINNVTQSKIEVRTVSTQVPNELSSPLEIYQFDEVSQATMLLDEERRTWFMYYRSGDHYGVKLAPVGVPDDSPPTPPENLDATVISDRQVQLSWNPATDPETGIVLYRVFRDGLPIATVKGWSYLDSGLTEQEDYTYEVSAINYHGYEGGHSAPIMATTFADQTSPRIESVNSGSITNQVLIVFDEPVDEVSAEVPTNYQITPGVSVISASLEPDLQSVVLNTSEHTHGVYNLTVSNVFDRASTPNPIEINSRKSYMVTNIEGLVGAWPLDELSGEIAFDKANYGNDGDLIYSQLSGPSWTIGQIGGALQFDGIDDQVTLSGSGNLKELTDRSHTYAAWVRPERVPPGSTVNNTSYTILAREYTGLYYDMDKRFRATVRLSDVTEINVSSTVIEPGSWHHIVMVVNDLQKKLHLFIDGEEVDNSPMLYSGILFDHEDSPYYLGTSEPLTNFYEYRFQGKIDEVRVFDMALTTTEVHDLYNWFPNLLWDFSTHLPVVGK